MTWTRITDPETVSGLLPAWIGRRMVGLRGAFGLLMSTGDVVKLTSIAAAYQSSEGVILLDVLLDHGGVPEGVDLGRRHAGHRQPGPHRRRGGVHGAGDGGQPRRRDD
jgi:hypothetical protein